MSTSRVPHWEWTYSVLIIDDNWDTGNSLAEFLSARSGHLVTVAHDGEAGLRLAAVHPAGPVARRRPRWQRVEQEIRFPARDLRRIARQARERQERGLGESHAE